MSNGSTVTRNSNNEELAILETTVMDFLYLLSQLLMIINKSTQMVLVFFSI